jgi:hypothetical protein
MVAGREWLRPPDLSRGYLSRKRGAAQGKQHASSQAASGALKVNPFGRLLITFLLCHAGVLREPLLYLSLYFKQHRGDYYRLIDEVRKEGKWEEWLEFFLQGVLETSEAAVTTCRRLMTLFEEDRTRIQPRGRTAGSALRVHDALKQRPVAGMQDLARRAGLYFPAATSCVTGRTLLYNLKVWCHALNCDL